MQESSPSVGWHLSSRHWPMRATATVPPVLQATIPLSMATSTSTSDFDQKTERALVAGPSKLDCEGFSGGDDLHGVAGVGDDKGVNLVIGARGVVMEQDECSRTGHLG